MGWHVAEFDLEPFGDKDEPFWLAREDELIYMLLAATRVATTLGIDPAE